MGADVLPWFTAFLVGVVVALILLIGVVFLPRVGLTRALTRKFFCPWAHRPVVVRFLAERGGAPDRVMSCTAFADPFTVACERRCLAEEALAEPTPEEREPAVT